MGRGVTLLFLTILMNQEYIFLILEFKFHGPSPDIEADSFSPHINSGMCILEEWLPKYERNSKISFHIKDYEVHQYVGILDFYH